jgi:hypothetical protein
VADPAAILDYTLDTLTPANPDGSNPSANTNCLLVAGPGSTLYGDFASALAFDGTADLAGAFDVAAVDDTRFCVRLVMRVTAPVTGRQNLFEAAMPACSVHLHPGVAGTDFQLLGTVNNARNFWNGPVSQTRVNLKVDQWYALDLVYDLDTLGIFVDGALIGVWAFPHGTLVGAEAGDFVIGVHPSRNRWWLTGEIAMVQVFSGIPTELEVLLDAARANSEWFIRRKEMELSGVLDLGSKSGDLQNDWGSAVTLQLFEGGLISHASGFPQAFEMHGVIFQHYVSANLRAALGVLVSDEGAARAVGVRRSVFSMGAIYWSGHTGAVEVLERIYTSYEVLEGSASPIGLPIARQERIGGGLQQRFATGMMYHRDGQTSAFAVWGDILAKFLQTGGIGRWGYPLTHEASVVQSGGGEIGRQSQFEYATIYWSPQTGAHITYGAILATYLARGGPATPIGNNGLGFPTSDESDLPLIGLLPFLAGRYNTFQRGAIVYRGWTAAAPPFRIRFGNLTTKEDEGWGQGANDLYIHVEVKLNGAVVYGQRHPNSGAWQNSNSKNLDFTIPNLFVPNDPNMTIEIKMDVWDEDGGFGGGDDFVGTFTKLLYIGNAWGWGDNPLAIFQARDMGGIKSLDWSLLPDVPPGTPRDFWGVGNQGTSRISYRQYGVAFDDIDDDPEWSDPSDWTEALYFDDVIEDAAKNGNCFGMCVEALQSWAQQSLFGQPLARFTTWPPLEDTFNIKQLYQFGSQCLEFTEDNVKDEDLTATDVFTRTRDRSNAGDPCILWFFANSDYSGSGHAVVPIAWNDGGNPWTITVFDPNTMNVTTAVTVDPNRNTFLFNNANIRLSGSIGYTPWSVVNHRQTSPVWDPTLLLLGLMLVGIGANGETESVTDANGDNLFFNHNYSGKKDTYPGQFRQVVGLESSPRGEMLVRRVRPFPARGWLSPWALDTPLSVLLKAMQPPPRTSVMLNPQPLPPRAARELVRAQIPMDKLNVSLQSLVHGQPTLTHDPSGTAPAGRPLQAAAGLTGVAGLTSVQQGALNVIVDILRRQSAHYGPDYVHNVRGKGRGAFAYSQKFRTTVTRFQSLIEGGEVHRLDFSGLASSQPVQKLTTTRDKLVTVEQVIRMGISSEFLRLRIQNLPVRAGLDLNLSMRPGLAAIDVVTAGERVDALVEIEQWRGAQRRLQRFIVPVEGGLRFVPGNMLDGPQLKVGGIDRLFGAGRDLQVIKPI